MHNSLVSQVQQDLTRAVESSATELAGMIDQLYGQVRRMSAAELRRQFAGRALGSLTLSPTAIANDAMMRVLKQRAEVKTEGQFFALAARFVRQLVLDYRKHRLADKRGRGQRGADVNALADEIPQAGGSSDSSLLPALDRLADEYPRKAEVVTLYVLCGNTFDEISQRIGVSRSTVERDWSFAKAWLADAMKSLG